jgi:predicted membrane protein
VNTTALAITFIGWYYFVRFLFEKKNKMLYLTVFFFLLAGTLKITALFSLFAIGGIFLLELGGLKRFSAAGKIFTKPLSFIVPAGLAVVLNAAWLFCVNKYNAKHDCAYFSTNTFPLWSLGKDDIHGVISNVKNIWISEYFHPSVYIFLSLLFIFVLLRFKKMNAIWSIILILVLLEILVYSLLQFRQFADHDYYVIDMFIFPVLLIICFFDWLKREQSKVFLSFFLKWGFIVFLGLNILNAKEKLKERYEGWMNDYPATKDFYTITPYLRQLGINPSDTVIAIPGGSHVALYLMNQKGWTEYTDMRLHKEAPIPYNADSAGIQSSINKGAKYLIVNGVEELNKKPYLKIFATHLIGRYNKILIFNLKDKTRNFNLDQRKELLHYICNAENISTDKEYFVNDSIRFEFVRTRSDSFAHSGKYSCRLDEQNPYGMTIRIKNAKEGESFVISAWRKINSPAGSTIISEAPNYYNNQYQVKETANGWEKLVKEFSVTPELNGKEFTIYLYNEDPRAAYFDDFEIMQYEAAFR